MFLAEKQINKKQFMPNNEALGRIWPTCYNEANSNEILKTLIH